jgi:hypothetical protein
MQVFFILFIFAFMLSAAFCSGTRRSPVSEPIIR